MREMFRTHKQTLIYLIVANLLLTFGFRIWQATFNNFCRGDPPRWARGYRWDTVPTRATRTARFSGGFSCTRPLRSKDHGVQCDGSWHRAHHH